ncbi:Protein-glutamate methylesterase [gamma proteobacterium HdN1]|nr:Protein-glutamate methylesterase [gamma proteobacterium HdN1]
MTELLRRLDVSYQRPTVFVLHQRAHRVSGVPSVLARLTHLRVVEPEDKQAIEAGYLYVAPPDYHLLVEPGKTFAYSVDRPVNYSRPSIDLLFESAAEVYRNRVVACILSGANRDGVVGAQAIKRRGGKVLVQSPETAKVAVMPRTVVYEVAVDASLPLSELALVLLEKPWLD